MLRLKISKLILLSLITCSWLSGCLSNEPTTSYTKPENYITHNNSRFNFSVDFPDSWKYEIYGTENYEATETREAFPTAGIDIINENDPDQRISVFGQNGTLMWDAISTTVVEDIVTFSGLNGTMYTDEIQDKIHVYFVFDHNQLFEKGYNTRSLGGTIQMSKEVYNKNKDDIELMIKSIRISK